MFLNLTINPAFSLIKECKNDEEFKATIRPFKTVPTNLNTENFINMLNGKISKSIKVKYFDVRKTSSDRSSLHRISN